MHTKALQMYFSQISVVMIDHCRDDDVTTVGQSMQSKKMQTKFVLGVFTVMCLSLKKQIMEKPIDF